MNTARLGRLPRQEIAPVAPPVLDLGHGAVDAALSGGLAAGAHQVAGVEAGDETAAIGFCASLMVRMLARRPAARGLWVQAPDPAREAGAAYAPGLRALGLDPDRIGVVQARSGADALRVVDEALRSGAVAAVLADLGRERRLDLSVTRRFNLSGRRADALALLIDHDLESTSAAMTRWRIRPHLSAGQRRRLGRPAFDLALIRNRLGPTGAWTLEWDSDDRLFRTPAPLSPPVARPAVDRPDPVREPRPGLAAGAYRQAV